MKPVLLEFYIFSNHIIVHSYVLLNFVALIMLLFFLYKTLLLYSNKPQKLAHSLCYLVGSAFVFILGARILYVLIFPDYFSTMSVSRFLLDINGFSILGGFLLLIPWFYIISRKQKIKFTILMDNTTPGLALYILWGKIGCFLNGCCFGTPTYLPWGVTYPAGSKPYMYYAINSLKELAQTYEIYPVKFHPVQLYESTVGLICFVIAYILLKRKYPSGTVFLGFASVYSLTRWKLHYWRAVPIQASNFEYLPYLYIICFIVSTALLLWKTINYISAKKTNIRESFSYK